ncbi:peptidase [Pleomorphomonas diazotrophica]|uniref:Peptidase n=1 Tax=Pleomorphomonas diazotrophica TaxID=1166257 RepID=A0A1I4RQU6_9HYPH|nr:prepilin peptidase [Pleomorphomonas diazotrophica]PKR88112.1 peptidase [Pleomorphomonas diazotrophica]SFM54581.1 prepilin peptidase CpaA [Pleomorphomonas diazotrophica]
MLIIATVLTAVFPIVVTVAASYDLLTMQIPNRFPAALAIAFLALALLTGLPLPALGIHVLAGLGLLIGTFALFAFGYLGGGDAKLASAIALWLGIEQALPFLVLTALFGGALSLTVLAFRSIPLPGFMLGWPPALRLHEKGAGVPYGVALAAAALMVFPETPWFAAFARL